MTEPDDTPTEALPPGPEPSKPKRLLRSTDDRVIAGVAGGLGRYFDVDPVIFRIGFAVSVFFGGIGLLAYVALALFVPTGAPDGSVAEPPAVQRSRGLAIAAGIGLLLIVLSWGALDIGGPFGWHHRGWFIGPPLILLVVGAILYYLFRRTPPRGIGGILVRVALAITVIVAFGVLALASAWAAATGHGVAIAIAIIAIGVMLILSAFRGGARWLIVPAVALAVPLGAIAATNIRFSDGIGERHYRPASFSSVPTDGYELGIGQLVVDLRQLPWSPDTSLDLNVDLGMGQLIVAVPEDVCVSADVSTRAGSLDVAGDRADGVDAEIQPEAPQAARPVLNLTGEVDLGELRVVNLDNAELEGPASWRFGHQSDGQMRSAMDAACRVPAEPPTPDRTQQSKQKKGRH